MQFSWKNSKAHTRVSITCALASQTNTASRCLSVYMMQATTAPTLHLWNDSGLERYSIHFCCSVAKLCLTVCNPVDRSTPGFPVHLFPRVCSDSCPLSWWCCLTISCSAFLFFCLQSFPASGSLPMNRLFASGGQNIGLSASALVLPVNIEGWFPLEWLLWSPWSLKDSQESSPPVCLTWKRLRPALAGTPLWDTHLTLY